MTAPERITKAERTELLKVIRARERVAKADADHRAAELRADVEDKLAATYTFDDDAWADVTAAAERAIAEADAQIAERCRKLGVPERFRPQLRVHWYGRGENAMKDRRAELRKVAQTRIEAATKQAKHQVASWSVEAQTRLVEEGLESSRARQFLAELPTAEALMPPLEVTELEEQLGDRRRLSPGGGL